MEHTRFVGLDIHKERISIAMRGAPQRGFSTLICRINARSPASICGRPPKDRDFQRQ
jgi:hypothetical protein